VLSKTQLVDRGGELQRIHALLQGARESHSGVLLIEGEPGVGKSALLSAAEDAASCLRVLRARGMQSEFDLPYGGLGRLLRPVEPFMESLEPWPADVLRAALGWPGEHQQGVRDRFAVGAASLALLGVTAEEGPLLALIDDAQWLDQPSLDALSFVAHRLYAEGIVLLLARRSGEGAQNFDDLPTLALSGLDATGAAALLPQVGMEGLSPEQIDILVAATGGNPLALVELPRLMTAEQLSAVLLTHQPVPISVTLQQAYLCQVCSLTRACQHALLIAALLDEADIRELQAALDQLELSLADLGEAEDLGLIDLTSSRPTFRHPLVASAITQRAGPTQRRRAHAAVAAALTDSPQPGDQARRAWHHASATVGVDEQAAAGLEQVAAQAVDVAGFSSAGTAYERAAQLSPQDSARRRRYLAAADAAYHAGHTDRARRLLDLAAQASSGDPESELIAVEIASRLHLAQRRPDRALTQLTHAAEKTAARDPLRAAQLLIEAVTAAGFMGDTAAALGGAQRAADLVPDDSVIRQIVDATLGAAHMICGESRRGLPLLGRFPDVARLVADAPQLLSVASSYAFCLSIVDKFDEAAAVYEVIIPQATRIGATAVLPFALCQQAVNQWRTGDYAHAASEVNRALELARYTARWPERPAALALAGFFKSCRGHAAECRRDMREAIQVAADSGVSAQEAWAHYMLGLFELGEGRTEEAILPLRRSQLLCERLGLMEMAHWQWAPELVEAYTQAGETTSAEPLVAKLEWHAARTSRPIVLALAARCRGLTTPDGFEKHFTDALRWHHTAARPFEHARTQLCYGERLRRAKQRTAARAQLNAAWRTFQRLGATPWAERARAELAATGLTTVSADTGSTATLLTPQELQVAVTVAAGASNREAATRLFLSPKTIEYHLSHIYRKLEVDSRDELASVLGQDTRDVVVSLPTPRALTTVRQPAALPAESLPTRQ